MLRLVIFLIRLVNLYLYFVLGACLLSWVPNVNPDYPLFNFIFTASGFYLLPPVMGFSFAPVFVLVIIGLILMGLEKIYQKLTEKEPKVIYVSPEQFMKHFTQSQRVLDEKKNLEKEQGKDSEDGSN